MRKQQKITVKSYVHYRGELVEFDDLPPDVKQKAATELALRYFNTLFAGKAVFTVSDDPNGPRPGAGFYKTEEKEEVKFETTFPTS